MVQMRRGVDTMHRTETKMTAGDNLGTLRLMKVEAGKSTKPIWNDMMLMFPWVLLGL